MAEDASTLWRVEGDAAELGAFDAWDAVVAGEALIEEGVGGINQIEDAAVVTDECCEEELGLLLHGFAEGLVELGEFLGWV